MQEFIAQFLIQFTKSIPLFILIGVGYSMSRWFGFSKAAGNAICKFAFNVSLTAMLFRLMASQHKETVSADPMLLVAFFGTCLTLLLLFRWFSIHVLKLSAAEGALFGTGTVFCNTGLLGIPLAIVMLGDKYIPSFACVLTFNATILWTAVSILMEVSKVSDQKFSLKSFLHSVAVVFRNPLIISIFLGFFWNLTKIDLPYVVDEPLRMLGSSATPLSLIAVGMGLAEYGIGKGLTISSVLSVCKLTVQPICVYFFSKAIGLGDVETLAIVFLAGLPCGVNVYLMSKQFQCLEAEVANAMLITTVFASVTMPLLVTIMRHIGY